MALTFSREIYTFPDIEKLFIQWLPTILSNLGVDVSQVRVATKKLKDSSSAEPVEIIVRSDGASSEEDKLREEGVTIQVWITRDDENQAYSEANDLILLLCGAIQTIRYHAGSQIKWVSQGSWSPVEDEGKTQVRMLTADVITLAQREEYTINNHDS